MSGGISATTIAASVGAAAAVAGAGVSAVGAMQSASAQSQAATYNSEVAAQNTQIANNNATAAAQAGEQQAAVASGKTKAEVGAIKTSQAAGGIDVNSGSAVDVQSSAAQLGELNAITIRSNAARTAYGYQTQAAGYQDQSALDTSEAENASTAGDIGASSSILGGVGSAASNWQKYQTQAGAGMNASMNTSPINVMGS